MKKDVNYLQEIVAFNRWLPASDLSGTAVLLWYQLMWLFNSLGWKEWVGLDNVRLTSMAGLKSQKNGILARNKLVQAGLIEYKRGKKGCPNVYRLITFKSRCSPPGEPYPTPYPTPYSTPINKHKPKHKSIKESEDNSVTLDGLTKNTPNPSPPPVKNKKAYGEFENVLLSDDEHEKLSVRMPSAMEHYIAALDAYMQSTGKKYKSHYATVLSWERRDRQKGKAAKPPVPAALNDAKRARVYTSLDVPWCTDFFDTGDLEKLEAENKQAG